MNAQRKEETHMRKTFLLAALVVALASLMTASLALAGGQRTARAATVTAHASRFGKVLFDGHGRAVYLFKRDHSSRSSCSGACARAWPPFLTTGAPKAGPGARALAPARPVRTGTSCPPMRGGPRTRRSTGTGWP